MSKVLHEWTGRDGQSWRLMDHESGPYAVGERAVDVMDEAAINALHEDDDFDDEIMAELARVAAAKATLSAQVEALTKERDGLRKALERLLRDAVPVACDVKDGIHIVPMTAAEWAEVCEASDAARAALQGVRT